MKKFSCNDTLAENLLNEHKGAIIMEVRKYLKNKNEFDDFKQEAEITFIKAVDTFDPSKKTKFLTYALAMVRNRLITLNKDKYSEKMYKQHLAIDDTTCNLIVDKNKKNALDDYVTKEYLGGILSKLSKKEKEMVIMRSKNHTFREIGEKFNLSDKRIQQKISAIVKKHQNITS